MTLGKFSFSQHKLTDNKYIMHKNENQQTMKGNSNCVLVDAPSWSYVSSFNAPSTAGAALDSGTFSATNFERASEAVMEFSGMQFKAARKIESRDRMWEPMECKSSIKKDASGSRGPDRRRLEKQSHGLLDTLEMTGPVSRTSPE